MNSFIDYLNSEWFTQHPGWYLGIRHLTPTNNNSLEATNDVVKNEDTLRKSLLMNQMLVVSKSIVEKWSKARDPLKETAVRYSNYPTIELKDWTNAYQWSKTNKKNVIKNGNFLYTLSTTLSRDITKADIKESLELEAKLNYKDFKEYKDSFKIYCIKNDSYWKHLECNCVDFRKNYKCKHSFTSKKRLIVHQKLKMFQLEKEKTRWTK